MEIDNRVDVEHLLSEYGNRIFNMIYCMLGNYHETEDVFQEVFVLAHLNKHRFRGDSQPATWLYKIALNAVKSQIKRKQRHIRMVSNKELETLDAAVSNRMDDSAESQYLNNESNARIQNALLRLPLEFREVFVLKCIEGYSYKEIAGMTGVPIGTVESRLFRARDQLRKNLTDFE
jgi:RNA polymerase sigma-70 factor, ECF subfamily